MAAPKHSEEKLRKLQTDIKRYGSVRKYAREKGVPRQTVRSQIKQAESRGIYADVEFPSLPESSLSAKSLIDQACEQFTVHKTAHDARRWMEIKIKTDEPIGICFMGDPHIDNYGCNWPLLRRDISILEDTEGLYAVNIGDLTDNWVGRLMRLYADSSMSKKDGWKLAKYLLKDAKIKWLCHILGNHDLWNDGALLIKANAHPLVPVEEWQSRFQVVFKNNVRVRVHVAHNFPGTSIWNEMHGPKKASMMEEQADIYACGHKHQWAIHEGENSQRDFLYWLIRARGYKTLDSYANVRGYGSQEYGSSVTAIIDPNNTGVVRIRCFPDLAEAAEFLKWKRKNGLFSNGRRKVASSTKKRV